MRTRTLLTAALLSLACNEYDLKGTADSGRAPDTASDAEDPAETGDPVETGDTAPPGAPAAEADGSLLLETTCLEATSATATLSNVGDAPLSVLSAEIEAPADGALSVEPDRALAASLEPGGAMSFEVTWEPGASDQFSSTLTIETDDPDQPTQEIDVAGLSLPDGEPPAVTISGLECVSLLPGDGLALEGAALDPEGDADDVLYAVWESDVDGVLQEGPLSETWLLEAELSGGLHTITLTVTDSCDLSDSASVEVEQLEVYDYYMGPSPDGLTFDDDGYLWVADFATNIVYQLEAATLGVLRELPLSGSGADGLTWMDDQLLVSLYYSNEVVFVDPCDGAIIDRWGAPGSGVSDVSWDGATLWLTDHSSNTVYDVDPATGSALASYRAPFNDPNGLAWDGTDFWMTANGYPSYLARLDTSFSVLEYYDHDGYDPRGVAWDGTDIWYSDGTAWLIDVLVP